MNVGNILAVAGVQMHPKKSQCYHAIFVGKTTFTQEITIGILTERLFVKNVWRRKRKPQNRKGD